MIHLDRILLPTDGSACAERARKHAAHLADHFDAELHVIHVLKREREPAGPPESRIADVLDELHPTSGEEVLRRGIPVTERRVAAPSAAEGILMYADEHDTNLVVVGTHGRRGFRRLMLGSVAEEVVRHAPRPVLTVGRGAQPPEAMEGGELLVPVDFSEFENRLLAHARELALSYRMKVTLLHVVEAEGLPDIYEVPAAETKPGVLVDRSRKMLEERARPIRRRDVDVHVEVRNGHPAEGTLQMAEKHDVGGLAIATHGRSGVKRALLGSVAEKVIRQAPCPVFVVKSFGASLVAEAENQA